MNNISINSSNSKEDTPVKKLIQVYRNNNMVLEDKLESEKNNVSKISKLLSDTNAKLVKMTEERDYWKVKFNRKNGWFSWNYAEEDEK